MASSVTFVVERVLPTAVGLSLTEAMSSRNRACGTTLQPTAPKALAVRYEQASTVPINTSACLKGNGQAVVRAVAICPNCRGQHAV